MVAAAGGTGNGTQGGPGDKGGPGDTRRTITAIVVLILYGGLLLWLLTQFSLDDKEWTRLTWVVKGFEAIVFAAAGFLFGRQVNRERAEKAETRADAKTEETKKEHAAARIFKDRLDSVARTARQRAGADEVTFTASPHSAQLRAIAEIAEKEDPLGWRA